MCNDETDLNTPSRFQLDAIASASAFLSMLAAGIALLISLGSTRIAEKSNEIAEESLRQASEADLRSDSAAESMKQLATLANELDGESVKLAHASTMLSAAAMDFDMRLSSSNVHLSLGQPHEDGVKSDRVTPKDEELALVVTNLGPSPAFGGRAFLINGSDGDPFEHINSLYGGGVFKHNGGGRTQLIRSIPVSETKNIFLSTGALAEKLLATNADESKRSSSTVHVGFSYTDASMDEAYQVQCLEVFLSGKLQDWKKLSEDKLRSLGVRSPVLAAVDMPGGRSFQYKVCENPNHNCEYNASIDW